MSYGPDQTIQRRAALMVARDCHDTDLVGWLALEHPDDDVRREACANLMCPLPVLLELSADPATVEWLLARIHLPTPVMARIVDVETRRYLLSPEPRMFRRRLLALAIHDACPSDRVPALVGHATTGDHALKVAAAHAVWNAPHVKRDDVHLQLLIGARRSDRSRELVEAITRGSSARLDWLETQGAHCAMLVADHRRQDRARSQRVPRL
ncbi:hypothetical protein [Rhodococcus rhodnii]|uniref:HEAT repeat domain-containing protein n=1 Tax=Rhodococcus rhodnii LMG 5362 TaxID=1273125 RepID=R7WLT9_9NOCA|nr:hypothetical protein [Rhodococcus rhodnii]EOM74974.1 hypothetical protein Rrhod_3694 [Rhodococcus rhodnii LMG 5362]